MSSNESVIPIEFQRPTPERIEAALKNVEALERVTQKEEIIGFLNNFYVLFLARHNDPSVENWQTDKAKALGGLWQKFLEENTELLAQIDVVLEDWEKYNQLAQISRSFINVHDFDAAIAFEKRVDPNIGLDAINIPIWRRLNPLLEKAAEAMKKVGIDPKQFHG